MTTAEILAAVPHRPPMLLLDEIIERSENQIKCRKTFRPDEFFFQGHYPGYALVPGVILCEAAMQAGAVLLSAFSQGAGAVPVVGRLNDVKFKAMVHPGDTIEIETTMDEKHSGAFFLSGKVTLAGKPACTLKFVVIMAPKQ
jgi:3-hydroxyacyl-[acyl-carrier-protein] dehydratase